MNDDDFSTCTISALVPPKTGNGDWIEDKRGTTNNKLTAQRLSLPNKTSEIKPRYLESLTLVERLHRRLLDVITDALDRCSHSHLSAVQALLIFNIGEADLTPGELRTRGYYLGSNVSYNLKKLLEAGYIHHQRSRVDRRSVRVSLTEKGQVIAKFVDELYDRQAALIDRAGTMTPAQFGEMNLSLRRLERFWSDQIVFRA